MRALGHKFGKMDVVSKVLRSLTPKLDFCCYSDRGESKKLSKLTLDDLTSTLLAHEVKVNRASAKLGDKALVMKGDSSNTNHNKGNSSGNSWREGRGRGRGYVRGRGKGPAGRRRGSINRSQVQCFHCKKFGHTKEIAGQGRSSLRRKRVWWLKRKRSAIFSW